MISVSIFCIVLVASVIHFRGLRRIGFLRDVPVPSSSESRPRVSVIVAARNEQKNIESALLSLLQFDYPNKEILVVNDRSTDRTGDILEHVQRRHPELKVITVTELPPDWLGKNHAHFVGAETARGEFLLFTDADIVMDPTVLSRAVSHITMQGLDHLAMAPRVDLPGWALNVAMAGFQLFFNGFTRVWKVSDPKSSAFIGIGAFNMMRRTAYQAIGTHKMIRMRPDDDMQLGRWIKKKGFRQGFLFGTDLLHVEWYSSLKELIEGLMKNSFSAANYHLSIVVGGTILLITFLLGPFIGIFLTHGAAQLLNLASSALLIGCAMDGARTQRQNPIYALGLPFSMLLLVYISWKASLRTLIRGGIEWRGTFYSLKELRKDHSLFSYYR